MPVLLEDNHSKTPPGAVVLTLMCLKLATRPAMPNSESKDLDSISYSRADNEQDGRLWADWIKETIEGISIPINCQVPNAGEDGKPGSHREVFLDRSRLTAGGELMEQLEQHLRMSQYLVLICSPKSAGSEFVAFEIEHFKKTRRADTIIPIVVDGRDSKADPRECWVPPNLYDIIPVTDENGNVVATKERHLIYADSLFTVTKDGASASAILTIPVSASLLDQWRLTHFQTTFNTGLSTDGADPDHDGQTNLSEYAPPGSSAFYRLRVSAP